MADGQFCRDGVQVYERTVESLRSAREDADEANATMEAQNLEMAARVVRAPGRTAMWWWGWGWGSSTKTNT